MIFTPSQEIHDRLRAERAGVFIDRSLNEPHRWLVAKLPTNLIREIMAGAPVSLRTWVVAIDDKLVLSFGLTVFDDPASPMTIFGSCRSDGEAADLRVLLAAGAFPIQFFNETFLPVLYADCRVDPNLARGVLTDRCAMKVTLCRCRTRHFPSFLANQCNFHCAAVSKLVPSVGYPEAVGLKIRERANDVVQDVLSGKSEPRIRTSCDLPITFAETQTTQVLIADVGEVQLTDSDEGGELEVLTLQAFEHLFPFGAFIHPWVGGGKKQRELCDVLAVSRVREVDSEGIFVVQNKVAAAFPDGLKRTTERRASSIQKNILKAIGQLGGAIKALKAGETVYREKGGTSIEVDPPIPELAGAVAPLNLKERANQVGHGIIVISEMHGSVGWSEVLRALAKVSVATGYCCQVLDLPELGRLVTHSHGRPAVLEDRLLKRAEAMVESRNPLVRFNFIV